VPIQSSAAQRTLRAIPAIRAFSLIELLVVVALLGVFVRMAMPGFVSALESNRRSTITNRLMEDLAVARLQALSISSSMVLCPSDSASSVTYRCAASTDWSNGWYVYAGTSIVVAPATISASAVLRAPQPLPSGWKMDASLSSPGTYVNLDARSSSTKYGHFTIYRSGYSTTAGCVALSATARARAYQANVGSGVVSPSNDPC